MQPLRVAQRKKYFELPPHSQVADPLAFRTEWAWGLPLTVVTVVIHTVGLVLLSQRAVRVSSEWIGRRRPKGAFVARMGVTTLLATRLHRIEAAIWAAPTSFSARYLTSDPRYSIR